MSFSNPRRTPVTRGENAAATGLGHKMNPSLPKGSTFHSPLTPPTSPSSNTTFKVPSLPQRSQTSLDDVVDAHRRRAALTIGNFDKTLAAARPSVSSSRRNIRDNCSPVPQGLLDSAVGTTMACDSGSQGSERRILRPRNRRSRHHESDSGLGTSIASTTQKKNEGAMTPAGAITRSATPAKGEAAVRLSQRSINRILEHIVQPLRAKRALKDFRPIVESCPKMITDKKIVTLRDLEKTLLGLAPEQAKTVELFLDFCTTTIHCIQATVEYLPDREQTRPDDRPYNHGYFIDLVEQIHHHAEQMREARERQAAGETLGEMDTDPTDEIKLMGGLSTTGRPAELVRVKKNGKTFSLATDQPFEELDDEKSPIAFKRSMSSGYEDPDEVMRSMARRKKNPTPEELAPKKCKHPGCTKEFKRPCDLTKHEKTHSRPWKCSFSTCKYHEFGWPTEKERDRHVNDKHSSAPPMFECHYKPCPYKSKRESNCKQHMEKAHGWTYVRTKTNGKKADGSIATPVVHNLPTPSSENSHSVMTPSEEHFNSYANKDSIDFPAYSAVDPAFPSADEFNDELLDQHMFDNTTMPSLDFSTEDMTPEDLSSPGDNGTPSTDLGQFNNYQDFSPDFNNGQFEDIYGAHVQLPAQPNFAYNTKATDASMMNFIPNTCAPVPAPHISPVGHGNTMLYTPNSMIDEGFEDIQQQADQFNADFMLFPPASKAQEYDDSLFSTMPPSMAAGFTQPSSQDFNIDPLHTNVDWSDFQNFGSQN